MGIGSRDYRGKKSHETPSGSGNPPESWWSSNESVKAGESGAPVSDAGSDGWSSTGGWG